MYWRKGFSYVHFVTAFNISKSLFLPFQKHSCFCWIFCVSFPCLGTEKTQPESLIGHTMAEPSLTQWNFSFMKADLLFMFTVVC